MMDNGSDDEQEDLLSGMSDLEKLKQGLAKRKYTIFARLLFADEHAAAQILFKFPIIHAWHLLTGRCDLLLCRLTSE